MSSIPNGMFSCVCDSRDQWFGSYSPVWSLSEDKAGSDCGNNDHSSSQTSTVSIYFILPENCTFWETESCYSQSDMQGPINTTQVVCGTLGKNSPFMQRLTIFFLLCLNLLMLQRVRNQTKASICVSSSICHESWGDSQLLTDFVLTSGVFNFIPFLSLLGPFSSFSLISAVPSHPLMYFISLVYTCSFYMCLSLPHACVSR